MNSNSYSINLSIFYIQNILLNFQKRPKLFETLVIIIIIIDNLKNLWF